MGWCIPRFISPIPPYAKAGCNVFCWAVMCFALPKRLCHGDAAYLTKRRIFVVAVACGILVPWEKAAFDAPGGVAHLRQRVL
jgi:hypothetical protein